MNANDACDLDSVIATAELDRRAVRRPNHQRESSATLGLVQALAEDPSNFFQELVQAALELSSAESTGISLLDEERGRFVWPAIAGRLCSYLGSGTPRDFGPCGTVLDRNAALLFQHPERHFSYLSPITPPLEEVLLIPFHIDGNAVGTIWAVIHERDQKFDAEDKRLLEELSSFAASAYRVLMDAGALTPLIRGANG